MPDFDRMKAAIHEYLAAIDAADAERIAALFSETATVEDPVGTPLHRGRAAIRAFYESAIPGRTRLRSYRHPRFFADNEAFPSVINLAWEEEESEIDAIDSFRFNDAGEIVEMRTFLGPGNFTTFVS